MGILLFSMACSVTVSHQVMALEVALCAAVSGHIHPQTHFRSILFGAAARLTNGVCPTALW